MIVRRALIVGLIAATGTVSTGGFVGASPGSGKPSSIVLTSKHEKALTKAQFITQANAFCAESVTAFAADLAQFSGIKKNPTPQAIAAFVKALSTIVQKQINETRALTPPKAERAAVTAFLRANETELKALEADPELLANSANKDPFLTADNLARNKLGLVGAAGSGPCSKGSGQGGGGGG